MLSGIIEFNLGLDKQVTREARSDIGRNVVLYNERIFPCVPLLCRNTLERLNLEDPIVT